MSLPLRLLLRLLILLLPLLRRFGTSDDSLSVNQLITDSAVFFTSCLPAVITKKTIQIMNATLINISNTPFAAFTSFDAVACVYQVQAPYRCH